MKPLPAVLQFYSHLQPIISKEVALPLPPSHRDGVWPAKTDLAVLNVSSTLLAFWLLCLCLLAFDSLPFYSFKGVGGALSLLYRIKPYVKLSPLSFYIHIGPKPL